MSGPPLEEIIEPESPGRFEQLGVRYIKHLARKELGHGYDFAADDVTLVRRVRRITLVNAALAFVIGALSAGGSVYTEIIFADSSLFVKYAWVAGVTAVLTALEFVVLFLVSLRAVYFIGRVTGHSRLHLDAEEFGFEIPNLLSRAALEIPDPVRRILGIDPLAHVSRRRLFLIGLLYKAKILASNVLAKLFLRRFFGKSLTRLSVLWVAVPITGFWNAFTVWKVAREARLRLFGNLLSYHIVTEEFTPEKLNRLSPAARLGCLRAVGNSVVLTQNHHPNMLILLVRLCQLLHVGEGQRFDDWSLLLETLGAVAEHERFFLLDLLAVSTALDGKLSRLERQRLPEAFGEHTAVYFKRIVDLRDHLLAGRLHAAKELCRLDFEIG